MTIVSCANPSSCKASQHPADAKCQPGQVSIGFTLFHHHYGSIRGQERYRKTFAVRSVGCTSARPTHTRGDWALNAIRAPRSVFAANYFSCQLAPRPAAGARSDGSARFPRGFRFGFLSLVSPKLGMGLQNASLTYQHNERPTAEQHTERAVLGAADPTLLGSERYVQPSLQTVWAQLEHHFVCHKLSLDRFSHLNEQAVSTMWREQTNESGEALSSAEREALIERYGELFGIWPIASMPIRGPDFARKPGKRLREQAFAFGRCEILPGDAWNPTAKPLQESSCHARRERTYRIHLWFAEAQWRCGFPLFDPIPR
jgi:hypothetical protein